MINTLFFSSPSSRRFVSFAPVVINSRPPCCFQPSPYSCCSQHSSVIINACFFTINMYETSWSFAFSLNQSAAVVVLISPQLPVKMLRATNVANAAHCPHTSQPKTDRTHRRNDILGSGFSTLIRLNLKALNTFRCVRSEPTADGYGVSAKCNIEA